MPGRIGLNYLDLTNNPTNDLMVFADNGATTPEGRQVAFIQTWPNEPTNTLSTTLTNLVVGQSYQVSLRVTRRSGVAGVPTMSLQVGNATIGSKVRAVGGKNSYLLVARDFIATNSSMPLAITSSSSEDAALVLDAVQVVPTLAGTFFTVSHWTGDASSGIDSGAVYTHAVNFGAASISPVINGVTFTGVDGGNPSVANSFSVTDRGGVYNGNPNNNLPSGSGSRSLANDFLFNGQSSGALTLQGLTPGKRYRTTLFGTGWDASGHRLSTFTANGRSFKPSLNQFGQGEGVRLDVEFTATGTTQAISYDGSWHIAGFANRLLSDEVETFTVAPWSGDASSGISSGASYTHAYNFGTTRNAVINGVTFRGVAGGNPSGSDFFLSGPAVILNGNSGSNQQPEGSGSRVLADDFVYGGNEGSLTLTGLVSGRRYRTTLFGIGWDATGHRTATLTSGSRAFTVDENAYGQGNGLRVEVEFTAEGSSHTIRYVNLGEASWHWLGFANRDISVPAAPVLTSPDGLLTGNLGQPFSYSATVTPSPTTYPTTYQITGTLPAGLTLDAGTGVIHGTPTQAEEHTVALTASNAGGTSSPLLLQIRVPGEGIDPYDQWLSAQTGLANPSGTADPDGDGRTTFSEYAFGGNPAAADPVSWSVGTSGASFVFTWMQRTGGSVVYALQECADLATGAWVNSAAAVTPVTGRATPSGYEWKGISVSAAGRKFYRVATVPQVQGLSFPPLPTKTLGLPSFTLSGSSSSGLPLTYTSSNPQVATISGQTVTLVGTGTTTITASQPGNSTYQGAAAVSQTLTVAPRTSLTVNAKTDFGAAGDGVADDTVPLQKALDYLAANLVRDGGGCLVLPPGTYRITRRLNFERAEPPANFGLNYGLTVRGAESEGSDATILHAATHEGALFFNVNDTEHHFGQFGVRIQDLQIRAGVADAGAAIEVQRMPTADTIQAVVPLVKNVAITRGGPGQYFRYGFVGRRVLLPEFTDVRVTGDRQGTRAGILLDRHYSYAFNNCTLTDMHMGIDTRKGGEGAVIEHTTLTNVNTGIHMHVDPYDFTGPSGLGGALIGCNISAWDSGVILEGKGFFPIHDNRFVSLGNDPNFRHLTVRQSHHVIVSENEFTGAAGQTGVLVQSPLTEDNTVAHNRFGSVGTAVRIEAGVASTTVLDNAPAAASVINGGSLTVVRTNAPRTFRETATRLPAYGYRPGRVLVPWNQLVHGPIVKVTDYGANGVDGLDDTAALQSAVNALQATLDSGGSGTLYFPAGLYHLSTRLHLTQGGANWQKLTIAGDGSHVSGLAVTGFEGVFKIDCTQPVPIFLHGFRIDPHTANPSTAIEVTQQNGSPTGDRSLLIQDVRLFTWEPKEDDDGNPTPRYFSGGIKATGTVRPLLQFVDMRSVGNDNASLFGLHFTGGYGFDWQGGNIYGKQSGGIIESLGGGVNIRGPSFNGGGLTGLVVDANGGSFSMNNSHIDCPVNLRVKNANDVVVINTLTIAGPQNPNPPTGTTFSFLNCTNLVVRDNMLAAAYLTPRPDNVFINLGAAPETCNGFDLSGNMIIFNENEGVGIRIPAGNLNGKVSHNRFFGTSVQDIDNREASTQILLLPRD